MSLRGFPRCLKWEDSRCGQYHSTEGTVCIKSRLSPSISLSLCFPTRNTRSPVSPNFCCCAFSTMMLRHSSYFSVAMMRHSGQEQLGDKGFIWLIYRSQPIIKESHDRDSSRNRGDTLLTDSLACSLLVFLHSPDPRA